MITAGWMSQAIRAAVDLHLPDLLADGHRELAVLAGRTGCNVEALGRLLRALAALGLVSEDEAGRFDLTQTGRRLCADHPAGLAATALWWGRHLWPLWDGLVDSVRQGESVRRLRCGQTGFAHLASDPAAAQVFHRSMAEVTRLAVPALLAAFDFASARRVIDLGGGDGELLLHLLRAHRRMRGVLLETPAAIGRARSRFAAAKLARRCECVAGSFFDALPTGGDVYVLKNVLHNWDDAACARILRRCREAMDAAARLLIVERVRAPRLQDCAADRAQARADLNMLISLGARERSAGEFGGLLRSAGFGVIEIGAAALDYRVMVASRG